MHGSYLGPSFGQSDIEARLSALGAKFQVQGEAELIETCATALAEGKAMDGFMVGWNSVHVHWEHIHPRRRAFSDYAKNS